MSLAADIRNFLALHKRRDGTYRARLIGEIARGIGYPADPAKAERFHRDIGYSLAQQVDAGYLHRTYLSAKKCEYSFIHHPPEKVRMDPAVRRERKNERERARARQQNKERGRSWAEYVAAVRAEAERNAPTREANIKARQARSTELKRQKRAEERANRPPRVFKQKVDGRSQRRSIASVVASMRPGAEAPVIQRIETVEEWQARTGQKPEVIPPGVVSQPLRHITPHEQNAISWKARKRRLKEAA